MTRRRARPSRTPVVLAVALLTLALAEALFSDEQPEPTAIRLLAALVPAVAVAFVRVQPQGAAAAMVATLVLSSLQESPAGTLGAGFAWLVVVFGVAAWSHQPWAWLVALAVSGSVRDLRSVDMDLSDVVINLAFVGLVSWTGRLLYRRTTRADALDHRLELADAERELSVREAVDRERAVLARELHDIVAHSVSLIVVQAGTTQPSARRIDPELADVLATIEHAGRDALTELRRLLHVLRSEGEPRLQPVPDLDRLTELFESFRRAGVDLRTNVEVSAKVPPGVALCAYRAVQEGLTNALRHAEGSTVQVDVVEHLATLLVRVRSGAPQSPAAPIGTGTGLVGLRERVLLCGGRFSARAEEGGFLLEVCLPLSDVTEISDIAVADRRPT